MHRRAEELEHSRIVAVEEKKKTRTPNNYYLLSPAPNFLPNLLRTLLNLFRIKFNRNGDEKKTEFLVPPRAGRSFLGRYVTESSAVQSELQNRCP